MGKWIGIDLDGTLATYKGGQGRAIGKPIQESLDLALSIMRSGTEVRIFTARASDASQINEVRKWLISHGLGACKITNVKDFDCHLIIDDRAARMEWNAGNLCNGCESETHRRLAQLGYVRGKIKSLVGLI